MPRNPFFLLLVCAVSASTLQWQCSQKNTGVDDPAWREESLRIAAEICAKISRCGKETGAFKGLDPAHAELADKRLQEASCQDHHRKTNVYRLAGAHPELIKASTRECHREMIGLECNDLVNKKYLNIPSCLTMGQIQKGELTPEMQSKKGSP